MAANNEKRCYTVKDLQEILDVSRPTVYDLLKRKEFHSVIVGGKHLISKKSFDAWLNGYSYEVEGNVSVGENRGEHMEPTQLQKQQGMTKPASLDANKTTDVTNQEAPKYLEMQERFLRNWMKAYMIIDSTGCTE